MHCIQQCSTYTNNYVPSALQEQMERQRKKEHTEQHNHTRATRPSNSVIHNSYTMPAHGSFHHGWRVIPTQCQLTAAHIVDAHCFYTNKQRIDSQTKFGNTHKSYNFTSVHYLTPVTLLVTYPVTVSDTLWAEGCRSLTCSGTKEILQSE